MPESPSIPGLEDARPEPGASSRHALIARIPRDWSEAAWVTLVVRLGLLAVGVFVWLQGSTPDPCHFEVARNGWATIPPLASGGVELPFVGIWQRWDACWYGKIAAFGYEQGTDATAFFPAFPLLVRSLALPLGDHVALAGMLANLVASVVGLAGLHRLVSRDLGVRVADRTILYLSIFPAALFLYAPFSEALFLAATAWAFVGAREGRWWLAAAAALVAGLTRTQGVLLVLPLAWEAAVAWRDGRLRSGARGGAAAGPRRRAPGLAPGASGGGRRPDRRLRGLRLVHVRRRRAPALRRAGRVGRPRAPSAVGDRRGRGRLDRVRRAVGRDRAPQRRDARALRGRHPARRPATPGVLHALRGRLDPPHRRPAPADPAHLDDPASSSWSSRSSRRSASPAGTVGSTSRGPSSPRSSSASRP